MCLLLLRLLHHLTKLWYPPFPLLIIIWIGQDTAGSNRASGGRERNPFKCSNTMQMDFRFWWAGGRWIQSLLSLTKKTREEVVMNRKVDDLFQFDKSCIALQFPNAFAALITCWFLALIRRWYPSMNSSSCSFYFSSFPSQLIVMSGNINNL